MSRSLTRSVARRPLKLSTLRSSAGSPTYSQGMAKDPELIVAEHGRRLAAPLAAVEANAALLEALAVDFRAGLAELEALTLELQEAGGSRPRS